VTAGTEARGEWTAEEDDEYEAAAIPPIVLCWRGTKVGSSLAMTKLPILSIISTFFWWYLRV